MKKYKLKQWYPSLGGDFEVKDIVYFDRIMGCYVSACDIDISLRKREVENNPDFWELIEEKEPLLITEDGVEIFEGDRFILVTDNFIKHELVACEILYVDGIYRAFKHESNADEYILWNKPLLSLQDIDVAIKGYLPEFDELKKLAEERLNHEK